MSLSRRIETNWVHELAHHGPLSTTASMAEPDVGGYCVWVAPTSTRPSNGSENVASGLASRNCSSAGTSVDGTNSALASSPGSALNAGAKYTSVVKIEYGLAAKLANNVGRNSNEPPPFSRTSNSTCVT